MPNVQSTLVVLGGLVVASLTDAALPPNVRFSWDTLPVFFHSANTTGPWSDAAVKAIARYPMATNEKSHAWGTASPGVTEETLNTHACRQVAEASNHTTATVYYLNSAIDWPFYRLHDAMVQHEEFRAVDENGAEVIIVGQWAFNHSVDQIRELWVADCVQAIDEGCSGCFIDRSNNLTVLNGSNPLSPFQAAQYAESHMQALTELNAQLAEKNAFAISNNEATLSIGTTTMMLEDFAASEHCIETLQLVVERGLAVQAHAGDLPDGYPGANNPCTNGDINAMTAFLIGAGDQCYYHWSIIVTVANRHNCSVIQNRQGE